jgi:hypothetical protein
VAVSIEPPALVVGISTAAMIAVPVAIVGGVLYHQGHRGAANLLGFVALVAVAIGAGRAARAQHQGTPLAHGLLTALALWVVLQAIRLAVRAIGHDPLQPAKAFSNLLLALVAGLIGALVAARRRPGAGSLPSDGGTRSGP